MAVTPHLSRRTLLGGTAAGTALALTGTTAAQAATAHSDQSILPNVKNIPSRKRLVDYEITELASMLRAGRVSSVEITQAYLDRIDKFNGPFETRPGDNFAVDSTRSSDVKSKYFKLSLKSCSVLLEILIFR